MSGTPVTVLETLLERAEQGALVQHIRQDFPPDCVEAAIANLKLLIAHAYKCGQLQATKERNGTD
jgi:hypothetical protein